MYYNDSSADYTSECYISSAMCVGCSDAYYTQVIIPYVLVMVVVYPIGIPLLYFILIYRQRYEILNRPLTHRGHSRVDGKYATDATDAATVPTTSSRGGSSRPPNDTNRTHGDHNRNTAETINNNNNSNDNNRSLNRESTEPNYGVAVAVASDVEQGQDESSINGDTSTNAATNQQLQQFQPIPDDNTSFNRSLNNESSTDNNNNRGIDLDSVYSDHSDSEEGMESAASTNKLSSETRALSLLYGLYLPSCAFFELFECLRRLALSGLMVFYVVCLLCSTLLSRTLLYVEL